MQTYETVHLSPFPHSISRIHFPIYLKGHEPPTATPLLSPLPLLPQTLNPLNSFSLYPSLTLSSRAENLLAWFFLWSWDESGS